MPLLVGVALRLGFFTPDPCAIEYAAQPSTNL